MAFPILQVVAAAASDMQNRNEAEQAKAQAFRDYMAQIRQHQTDLLGGGNPYDRMRTAHRAKMSRIDDIADQNSDNGIGQLLQSFFNQKSLEKKGTPAPSSSQPFSNARGVGEFPTFAESIGGSHDAMSGVDQLFGKESGNLIEPERLGAYRSGMDAVDDLLSTGSDEWDKDPWGDAGF